MIGYAGQAGALHILDKKRDDILSRYHFRYINKIKRADNDIRQFENIYSQYQDVFSHNVFKISEGGVLSTLYNLAENFKLGVRIEIKRVPIKQETIEICEFFSINPYKLYTEGYLIFDEDSKKLIKLLQDYKIEFKVIGKTSENTDRVIIDKTEIEYMNKVIEDEMYKII